MPQALLGPHTRCRATGDNSDDSPPKTVNYLEVIIKRKQKELEVVLTELGMESLEERLQSAVSSPARPPYKLSTLITESTPRGHCVLVFELSRPSPTTTPAQLAALAKAYVAMGADAICVRTDSDDTPSGTIDLFTVIQAVGRKVPVITRDWLIHPLQVVEIKESGAAGALGVICQVNGKGTTIMSSFSSAIGLDAPVEVINTREVEMLDRAGVAFFAINISVGISVAIPGFASDLAHGLLGQLPFGCISIVGVTSIEGARAARQSGADSLLIKREMLQAHEGQLDGLIDSLRYITSGDD
ncbi:MAG: hypothetical protein WDW36_003611 [Sanguina aurantia]